MQIRLKDICNYKTVLTQKFLPVLFILSNFLLIIGHKSFYKSESFTASYAACICCLCFYGKTRIFLSRNGCVHSLYSLNKCMKLHWSHWSLHFLVLWPSSYLRSRSERWETRSMVGMATVALERSRLSNSVSSPSLERLVSIGCWISVTPPKVTTLLWPRPAFAEPLKELP